MKKSSFTFFATTAFSVLALTGAACRGGGERPAPPSTDPTAIFGETDSTTAGTTPTAPEGMSCNHEYYPLRAGYHIQYRNTYPPSHGASGVGYYSQNVRRVTADSVYLTNAFETTGGGAPIEANVEYRCIGGALFAAGYIDTGSMMPGGSAYNNYQVTTKRAEGSFFPQHISVGSTWDAKFTVEINPRDPASPGSEERQLPPIAMDVKITRRAVGVERVTVPAGSYEAMKISSVTELDGRASITGFEWWVKDVGMVKSSMDAGGGAGSIVTEAMSVTVPR